MVMGTLTGDSFTIILTVHSKHQRSNWPEVQGRSLVLGLWTCPAWSRACRALCSPLATAGTAPATAVNDAGLPLQIGNLEYVPQALSPGQLRGNRFEVVLRGIAAPRAAVEAAVAATAERGFVNYYDQVPIAHHWPLMVT
jgi:hypothetical protein